MSSEHQLDHSESGILISIRNGEVFIEADRLDVKEVTIALYQLSSGEWNHLLIDSVYEAGERLGEPTSAHTICESLNEAWRRTKSKNLFSPTEVMDRFFPPSQASL